MSTPEQLFSAAQLSVLVDVAFGFSIVSLLGSAFICLSTFLFPKLRTFAFKLILALAISNIGLDIAYLLGNPASASTALCYAQGLMRVYFALVGFLLTTAITLTCYHMVVKQDLSITERLQRIMAVCWGAPLPLALLPLATRSYGDAGAWCSVVARGDGDAAGVAWRFAALYAPLWGAVAANAWMHAAASRALARLERAAAAAAGGGGGGGGDAESPASEHTGLVRGQSRALAVITRLRMYPVVLCVCWSWASVNRVYELAAPDAPQFWLYLLQYSFQTLNGVLNAFVYAVTPSVNEEWAQWAQQLHRRGQAWGAARRRRWRLGWVWSAAAGGGGSAASAESGGGGGGGGATAAAAGALSVKPE